MLWKILRQEVSTCELRHNEHKKVRLQVIKGDLIIQKKDIFQDSLLEKIILQPISIDHFFFMLQ